MKKIARSMRDHRELILNYFRAQAVFQRRRRGLNNRQSHYEDPTDFEPSARSNSRSITHLASCWNRIHPGIFLTNLIEKARIADRGNGGAQVSPSRTLFIR